MAYKKYEWVGNKIDDSDMAALYRMKTRTKRPITELVAEAVSIYVKKFENNRMKTESKEVI